MHTLVDPLPTNADPTTDSATDDLRIFAYGSLMWRPGFEFVDRRPATLVGYRRSFCIYSVHHRGCTTRPGLVLGLDRGGTCRGIVYSVAASCAPAVRRYLRAREQINGVYRETTANVILSGGHATQAVTYVAEPAHPSYIGRIPISRQAQLIRAAFGRSGPNLAYLSSTVEHLRALGIVEPEMERVASVVGSVLARGTEPDRERRALALARVLRDRPVDAKILQVGQRKRFMHRANLVRL